MKAQSSTKIALGTLALLFTVTFASAAEGAVREREPSRQVLEKYDADKDGRLNEDEKAAAKAGAIAKAKETREANLAKYDANKDGKLDEAERSAKKTDEEAARAARKAEKEAAKAAREPGGG